MFCTKCGNPLKENARFCTKCGAPVRSAGPAAAPMPAAAPQTAPAPQLQTVSTPVPAAQTQPAAPQSAVRTQPVEAPQTKTSVPPKSETAASTATAETASKTRKETARTETVTETPNTGNTAAETFRFRAPNVKGEAVLGELKRAGSSAGILPGPGQVITSSVKGFFTSLAAFFKNPLVMIPSLLFTLVIPLFWMLLNILQANGINPWPLKFLSFISCANGGMSGGFFGGFGGIIGKGVFVAGVVTLISLIFRKKGSTRRSFKDILKGAFGVSRDTLGVYFTGIGIALLLYLFLTGGATRISALCGVAAMFITASSALNGGFPVRFINSLLAKGKHASSQIGEGLMRGFTAGYAASSILGFITGTRIIPVILAIHFLIAGGILIILQLAGVIKPKKMYQKTML